MFYSKSLKACQLIYSSLGRIKSNWNTKSMRQRDGALFDRLHPRMRVGTFQSIEMLQEPNYDISNLGDSILFCMM